MAQKVRLPDPITVPAPRPRTAPDASARVLGHAAAGQRRSRRGGHSIFLSARWAAFQPPSASARHVAVLEGDAGARRGSGARRLARACELVCARRAGTRRRSAAPPLTPAVRAGHGEQSASGSPPAAGPRPWSCPTAPRAARCARACAPRFCDAASFFCSLGARVLTPLLLCMPQEWPHAATMATRGSPAGARGWLIARKARWRGGCPLARMRRRQQAMHWLSMEVRPHAPRAVPPRRERAGRGHGAHARPASAQAGVESRPQAPGPIS